MAMVHVVLNNEPVNATAFDEKNQQWMCCFGRRHCKVKYYFDIAAFLQ
jgi:hypothetical protein